MMTYMIDLPKGTIEEQVLMYLTKYDKQDTIPHLLEVAEESEMLAKEFGIDPTVAYQAGLLHDISVVIPNNQRVKFHEALGQPILPAEYQLPMLLHQQQSCLLAKRVFQIKDVQVLSAIACHTTLKSQATPMDYCLFIADKIKWDRPAQPPYLKQVMAALEQEGLAKSCYCYLEWLFQHDIQVVHPWAKAALEQLRVISQNEA